MKVYVGLHNWIKTTTSSLMYYRKITPQDVTDDILSIQYFCIKVNEVVPDHLVSKMSPEILESFNLVNSNYYPRSVGRLNFSHQHQLYTLDIVFQSCYDNSWTTEQIHEYTVGEMGYRYNWRYDLTDANLREMTMRWVGEIPEEMKNPMYVSRYLAASLSSHNRHDGLIVGQWKSYENGHSPSKWTRTSEVLFEYMKNGPVRYGQCWTFAEVLTSMLRFLGISARTVYATNSHIDMTFKSVIDLSMDFGTNKGHSHPLCLSPEFLTDFFRQTLVKDNSEPMIHTTEDSVWNIHYWVELYQSGWYVCDPSPVVPSKVEPVMFNNYVMGPCRVDHITRSIEEGWDFDFLYAIINSPFRLWRVETGRDIIPVPHTLCYVNHPGLFKGIKTPWVNNLNAKQVKILTRNTSGGQLNLTPHYTADPETLACRYYRNSPLVIKSKNSDTFSWMVRNTHRDREYYCQQICLDGETNIIKMQTWRGLLGEMFLFRPPRSTICISILLLDLKSLEWHVIIE